MRAYGEEKIEMLDRLGYASSKAEEGEPEPRGASAGRAFRAARPRPPHSAGVVSGSRAPGPRDRWARGIGKEIALRFAELGAAKVAISYLRNDKAAEQTAEELRAHGAEPLLSAATSARSNVAS